MSELPEPVSRPLTENEIRAAIVGELKPLTERIVLVDYDPEWPRLFESEAARVRAILGSQVLRLEHTGSTSVPGLAAKPIIDMTLEIPDSSDESKYVPSMEGAGYILRIREPDWHEHRLFKGPDSNINLHVFSAGCPEVDRMVLFRDWMREHPEDRQLYERTKRELASRDWKYVQNYADAKNSVVAEVMARAEASSTRHADDAAGERRSESSSPL
jgi:GrpB-like predicted nucleotidyltransferase (UPF0157 family)